MSLETAQKVIVPQKKNYVPQFLKQRDINSYCSQCHTMFCVLNGQNPVNKKDFVTKKIICYITNINMMIRMSARIFSSTMHSCICCAACSSVDHLLEPSATSFIVTWQLYNSVTFPLQSQQSKIITMYIRNKKHFLSGKDISKAVLVRCSREV
jgi:hypothetical protein